jgi:predicted nucleic acid-binding protein
MGVTSVYFDAALVAKFYVNEPGRDAVRAFAREMGRIATSGIAVAEVSAAFHRKLREGAIERDVFEALMGQFKRDLDNGLWYLAGPSEDLLRQVSAFFAELDGAVSVRSLDALHLITARSEGFARIYSNDRHLLRACAHANLEGIDPVMGRRSANAQRDSP